MSVGAPADVVDLEVESIAAGGDGVGRSEGLVVFVPRSAPGDLARVRVESVKRFARGRLATLLRPSPDRIEPPCHHYRVDNCGACQLQHMKYFAQLSAKQRIVRDALHRIARRTVDLPNILPSAREWRYRTKLTLAMRRSSDGWRMGLHPYDDPVAIFQLADCPISDERVVTAWREVMHAAEHLPDNDELRGTVRLAGDAIVIVVRGGENWPRSEKFFSSVPSASSLWWGEQGNVPRLLHERHAVPAAASFAQVNAVVAGALRDHVVECVTAYKPATIVDAYAGTGEMATRLANSGARVTAIEVDREAALLCARSLPEGSRSLVGRVESMLMKALPADVVIVNPPRGGLDERVTSILNNQPTPSRAIVYVSCDPATLARDLTRLRSYDIASVRAFDMFPQTAHVETVCELVPATA
jgi:23S rRNA (uracil1939-C5)-methyltransferase